MGYLSLHDTVVCLCCMSLRRLSAYPYLFVCFYVELRYCVGKHSCTQIYTPASHIFCAFVFWGWDVDTWKTVLMKELANMHHLIHVR